MSADTDGLMEQALAWTHGLDDGEIPSMLDAQSLIAALAAALEAAEAQLALVLDASEMANRVRVRDELLVAAEAQRDEWMAGCQEAVRMVDQLDKSCALLAAQRDTLAEALQRIEALATTAYNGLDCTCGHKPDFCHKLNASRWCGGTETPAVWIARAALAGVAPPEEQPK